LRFSGEDFPEPGTAQAFKDRGHELNTGRPFYLVHLYVRGLIFSAAVEWKVPRAIDRSQAGTATLFNDRYGMERIHYHESKDAFYFAAEAKAILAVRPRLRRMDPRGVGEFIRLRRQSWKPDAV